mmetsp:Transcript_9930/g.23327  ORF Transcript_9930/g.23327 Transcript_9930/m.23327 type:complete len:225 (+) Transcript_9930:248-922(+)
MRVSNARVCAAWACHGSDTATRPLTSKPRSMRPACATCHSTVSDSAENTAAVPNCSAVIVRRSQRLAVPSLWLRPASEAAGRTRSAISVSGKALAVAMATHSSAVRPRLAADSSGAVNDCCSSAAATGSLHQASNNPSAPARPATASASMKNWAASCAAPAPSDLRSPISRWRRKVRTPQRFTKLITARPSTPAAARARLPNCRRRSGLPAPCSAMSATGSARR